MARVFNFLCFLFISFRMKEELKILHWSNRPNCDARVEKWFEGYHSIQLMTRGHVFLAYDDEVHHLGGTCFWFHHPGPLIRLQAEGSGTWHHRHVAFRGKVCETWQEAGLLGQGPLDCPAGRRAELTARFDDLLGWAEEGSMPSLAKCRAGLELLLWEIWEIRRNPTRNRSVVDAVAQFAAERSFRVGSYAELAASLGLSMSSLRRHVLDTTGLPLHGYVRSLRLREARRLLKQTDKNLPEIAADLGFTDGYYFNREFSRLAGITPGVYRRSEI